ncbi:MAG: SAM-dependent methyltransferase [Candidatus Dormibacteraeota bacterium]|nr:SAM-dependent methyltransferase [Candidatus Dormibacteraeota bacterium]
MSKDWTDWHLAYKDPASALSQRLAIVQARLRALLSAMPPGPIRAISMCAGQGRDLIGALIDHDRSGDVSALLVELDPGVAAAARSAASMAGLDAIEVVQGDAAMTDAYAGWLPADLVLVCGMFGNISDADIEVTVRSLPMLCARGGAVIWTRHRRPPDLTPAVRRWFIDSGFCEVSFDAPDNTSSSGIGTARLVAEPLPFRPSVRMFTFVR